MKVTEVFLAIIEFHTAIKLYHFQTKHYGAHKASDTLHKRFGNLYDKFLEVYQGKHGRIPPIHATVTVLSLTDRNVAKYCNKFVDFLHRATKETCATRKNADLCNIVDEMVADINQFVYLLSFK